ncbi:MAG: hypothetical protein IT287_03665 [Bdellovibrionaceae bacterium]|nr:hypothetical protein [Pseudobdellovibrionaceae bacterium]
MSTNTYDAWVSEVKKSLKLEELPPFQKKITDDFAISPISVGRSSEFLQKPFGVMSSFLAIQNYSELVSGQLQEWIKHPDVGLRFRQLDDVPQVDTLENKNLFLSQPFLFVPTKEQEDILAFVDKAKCVLNLGWSPLSFGLTRGEILKKPLNGLDKVAECASLRTPSTKWFYLSSAPYQWAGAQPHAELGILLSVAYELLREMDSCKMSLKDSVNKLSFGLSLGTDVLIEPAKIVALKLLFKKLIELVDSDAQEEIPPIYAMPSLRVYSGRQPWNNLIRNVLMCSSAIIGGAQGFKCIPYDVLNKNKQINALRESTNVPLLLSQEAHLQDVFNPLDGAPLFAGAIQTLSSQAWDFFKELEKKGGVFEAVRTGWLQMELLRQSEESTVKIKTLEHNLVGVNEFVDKRFRYHSSKTMEDQSASELVALENIIDPIFLDKTDDEYMSVQPLVISSLTNDWEVLQEQADRYKDKKLIVLKVPSPGAEKKSRLLAKTLNIIGCQHESIEENQIAEKVFAGSVVVLIVGDAQKENVLLTELRAVGGVRVLSFTTGSVSEAIHALREESTPYEVAEKIIEILGSVQ